METHAESLEKFYLNYAYRASRAAVLTIRIVAMCNVLLPFGIISIADFLNFVNNLTINSFELYTCTILRFKIVNIAQKLLFRREYLLFLLFCLLFLLGGFLLFSSALDIFVAEDDAEDRDDRRDYENDDMLV